MKIEENPVGDNRTVYHDPIASVMVPNMMLRVGKGKRESKWEVAVSTRVEGDQVLCIFYPGGSWEHEKWIPVSDIRLAWTVPGTNFMELCKQFTGAMIVTTRRNRKGATVH